MIHVIVYDTGRVSATRAIRKGRKVRTFNGGRPGHGESLDAFIVRCAGKDEVVVTDLRVKMSDIGSVNAE